MNAQIAPILAANVTELWRSLDSPVPASCGNCNVRESCFPFGLSAAEMGQVDDLVAIRRRIRRGEALYRAGEQFSCLYAVRFGSLKSSIVSLDGYDQVTGFHMAGEILGLDGIATGTYARSAKAVEDGEACAIPYARLEKLAKTVPALQANLRRALSREIVRQHDAMRLLGGTGAEQRVAAFLLDLSRRLAARGYSRSEFVLRMTRAEIGSFLGLALESVSRAVSHLAREGIIKYDRRTMHILNFEKLHMAAGSRSVRLLGRSVC